MIYYCRKSRPAHFPQNTPTCNKSHSLPGCVFLVNASPEDIYTGIKIDDLHPISGLDALLYNFFSWLLYRFTHSEKVSIHLRKYTRMHAPFSPHTILFNPELTYLGNTMAIPYMDRV